MIFGFLALGGLTILSRFFIDRGGKVVLKTWTKRDFISTVLWTLYIVMVCYFQWWPAVANVFIGGAK